LLIFTLFTSLVFADKAENESVKIDEDSIPLDNREIKRGGTPTVNSFAEVLEEPQQAVVSISTKKKMSAMQQDPRQEFLHRFFGAPLPPRQSLGEEEMLPLGLGSGVLISENGYILTNNHVIKDDRGDDVDEIEVQLTDDRKFKAVLIGSDPKTDVAVLKIDESNLPYIKMANSDNIKVGDVVFAVGNPMGVGLTVTMGIISAKGRSSLNILGDNSYENFIQTDASINMGNSGGALVDSEGRLIGVNTAILSRSGGNIGIGFAIPVNMARSILLSIVNQGQVKRGYLGVQIRDLSDEMVQLFGLDTTKGVLVERVQDDTPAAKAGFKHGDVILKIGNHRVSTANELRWKVSQMIPGSEVSVTLVRDGREMELTVILGDLNTLSMVDPEADRVELFKGIHVKNIGSGEREQFELDEDIKGIIVTEVERTSPFARGFSPGMVILEINRIKVTDVSKSKDLLKDGINGLYVLDRGTYRYITIRKQ
jgi:serine protease Do/serine protease DegQ